MAVVCTSPNDVIVHGIPSDSVVLAEGDILSIDCGAIIQGWHGDAAFTAPVGQVSEEAAKLIKVTEESLYAGIDQMVDGNRISDIGHAVQTVAEAAGFSVVREYVGHAIGTAMHEKPEIDRSWTTVWKPLEPEARRVAGMVMRVRGAQRSSCAA